MYPVHPQLDKRNFSKVHNAGFGIRSFIHSVLAAIYSPMLHRNLIHNHKPYERFTKNLNLASAIKLEKGSIKNIKEFLKSNQHLDIFVNIFEGRLSSISNDLQVWKYGKIGEGRKQINILHIFQYTNRKRQNYYYYIKNISTIHHFFQKKYPCLQCFERFTSRHRLENHLKKCTLPQPMYPSKGSLIEFDKKCKVKLL